jgi:surface protein
MFRGCTELTTIGNVSNWDTSSLTNIYNMFYNCYGLTSLDLSGWDTSEVTDMTEMFYNCYNLITLDLSDWDMGKVTSTYSYNMFYGCTSLTNLQAPKNIKCNISFGNCKNLTHDSLMSIINNLATTTLSRKLTLGSTNLAKLSEEEKAIATNKGWTLA